MSLGGRIRTLVEDRLLTAPNPFFSPTWSIDQSAVDHACRTIQEVGGMDAGTLVPRSLCAEICGQLDLAYAGRLAGVRTRLNARTGIAQVLNPLRAHRAMLELATQPLLLGIIERYLRRRIYLADIDVRRVPPMTMDDVDLRAGTAGVGYTSSHWHRDIRGRQMKVMIYLTDVGEGDSNFAFFPGTHRGFQHRPVRVESSRLSEQAAAALGIPTECFGPAGTTLVFDTNCVHRLRRKVTAQVRDSVTFYYTPGQELRALDVDPAELACLPDTAQMLFGGNGRRSH